jgi:hypothetical protein
MQAMQALLQTRRIEFRLFGIGVLWLCAALMEYAVMRQPGNAWFMPPEWQLRFEAIPIQQISTEFPIFAQTIAASILGVWLLRCARDGAFVICGICVFGELAYEFGQRSDFSAWLLPILPKVWPLDHIADYMGRGTFSVNHVMAIGLGGAIAYLVVLNTIPAKHPRG